VQNKFLKRTLQVKAKKLKRWEDDNKLHEQQKCWFKDDYEQH